MKTTIKIKIEGTTENILTELDGKEFWDETYDIQPMYVYLSDSNKLKNEVQADLLRNYLVDFNTIDIVSFIKDNDMVKKYKEANTDHDIDYDDIEMYIAEAITYWICGIGYSAFLIDMLEKKYETGDNNGK